MPIKVCLYWIVIYVVESSEIHMDISDNPGVECQIMGRTKRRRLKKSVQNNQAITIGQDKEFQHLVQWLKQSGWTPTARMTPATFPCTGRGIRTDEYIPTGEILVNIPGKLLMTVETASKSLFGWVFKRKTFLTQQVLAAHLVLEKHLGDQSFWAKYITSLPKKIATPIFTSCAEINALPEELASKVKDFKQNVSDLFDELRDSLSSDDKCPHCGLLILQVISIDCFLWAWFIINSRAVYICPDHNTDHNIQLSDLNCLALAPYLDMFNHSNEAKVQAFIDGSDGSYQIRTLGPHKKYSEVFIHYGDHSNIKLYLEYGFIIPNNIHDTLSVNFEDVYSIVAQEYPGTNISKIVFSFLKSHELLTNIYLSADGLSWSLKALVYVLLSSGKVDARTIQLNVYSNSYTESDIKAICNLGLLVVYSKRSQLLGVVEKMISRKSEMFLDKVSESFVMAIDLYKEYLNVLDQCEKSLVLT